MSKLFEYDNQMNRKLLPYIKQGRETENSGWNIFAHLVITKKIWLKRLQGEAWSHLSIWPEAGHEELESWLDENQHAFHTFLAEKSPEDLNQPFRYKNSKGKQFENRVIDTLLHLVTHGAYHRGQIAKLIKKSGQNPPNTDFITHIREEV